jgi:hypothetical protein
MILSQNNRQKSPLVFSVPEGDDPFTTRKDGSKSRLEPEFSAAFEPIARYWAVA